MNNDDDWWEKFEASAGASSRFNAARQEKASRKKSTHDLVKEMKYRPKIDVGDFDAKTSTVETFLREGYKVKITVMFRGRELLQPESGRRILDDVAERLTACADIEEPPRLDGRNMTMLLKPKVLRCGN